ncbi:fluoride efflux transporter FluC [Halomonas salifodinae]|uniref:fluoride efflux transporter FluC n=1 Tax=Halomonas salifodinae TaxID=438745 RepID=UPI0033AE78E1
MKWRLYLAAGAGSGLGALLRYGLALALWGAAFPWATLLANGLGAFAMGSIATLARVPGRWALSPVAQHFWLAGVCGGFTTFSLFSLETLRLWEAGLSSMALGYLGASVALWLLGAWGGILLGERLRARWAVAP